MIGKISRILSFSAVARQKIGIQSKNGKLKHPAGRKFLQAGNPLLMTARINPIHFFSAASSTKSLTDPARSLSSRKKVT
jgi:hypothetical protein